jgi:hypothetical protein
MINVGYWHLADVNISGVSPQAPKSQPCFWTADDLAAVVANVVIARPQRSPPRDCWRG